MQLSKFLDKVQDRAALTSRDSAMRATRATLNTLAERLWGNEPTDLAAQLPEEIGVHLQAEGAGTGERFDVDEFVRRVERRADAPAGEGRQQAEAVLGVLSEAVSRGEMRDVHQQLPGEYEKLFARK